MNILVHIKLKQQPILYGKRIIAPMIQVNDKVRFLPGRDAEYYVNGIKHTYAGTVGVVTELATNHPDISQDLVKVLWENPAINESCGVSGSWWVGQELIEVIK